MNDRIRHPFRTATRELGLTALVILAVGLAIWLLSVPADTRCIVRVEFAGSAKTYERILKAEECGTNTAAVVASLGYDVLFIAGYSIGLLLVCMIGAKAYVTGVARASFVAAAWCAVLAGIFDLTENAFLKYGLDGLWIYPKPEAPPDWTFEWAEGMALVKFVAIIPALVVTTVVVMWVVVRLITWGSAAAADQVVPVVGRRWTPPVRPSAMNKPDELTEVEGDVATAWRDNYRLPDGHVPTSENLVGVCLSGGGIRSATFSMGAVQSLAAAGILNQAQFLATVSGGGYFGAAYQNLRHRSQVEDQSLSVARAFAPGTAEEDHVRRHGKYIADGTIQWVAALFELLRNIVMSLGIVYACLVLSAWGAAYAYSAPAEWAAQLFPNGPNGPEVARTWAVIAVVVPLALALLVWVISGLLPFGWRNRLQQASGLCASLGIGVAAVGVVIPLLTSWIAANATASKPTDGVKIGAIAAIVTTAMTVWNALAKVRPQKQSEPDSSPPGLRNRTLLSAAGFAIRLLLTLAVVMAVALLALVVFLAELHNAITALRSGGKPWPPVIAALALVPIVAFFDQTRMSLHPFYKRRLASAFDVKLEGGVAVQPDYRTISTLSAYGRPLRADGGAPNAGDTSLRLVLCAAAHVSGPSLAPPGRRVIPFVFSSDYIGSPKLGYFPTSVLEGAVKTTTYASDITLMAASAISGAAFASSMGRASGPFDIILALSNARLGAWLPNPQYHHLRRSHPQAIPAQDHDRSPLPKVRRLGYFAREVFGVYPADDRFVYVTDGGHYENLGLVELLRRRCRTIYCVDASGDHSLAFTLAEAAALAYEELGVTISIDGFDLATLSAEKGDEKNVELRLLHQRLSRRSVVGGTFVYPAGVGGPAEGTLIVGKATLGQDLKERPEMFALKSHALIQKDFPGDETADQFFDVDQYQGYLVLGRLVGQRMSEDLSRS